MTKLETLEWDKIKPFQDELIRIIQSALPDTEAIYIFGSFAKNNAHDSSDLDLAVYWEKKPPAELIYHVKTEISSLVKRDIDLVDLVRADTVTQAQIVSESRLIYNRRPKELAFFETRVLSQYVQLNLERREILQDIIKRGQIYGR